MSHDNKRDLAKLGFAIIAIALFFALRYLYLSYSIDDHVPECEKLAPREVPLDSPNHVDQEKTYHQEKLNFSGKKRISWRRYGFRRKIEVKQRTILTQGIVESTELEHIFYGVYKDSRLREPVGEVSMKYIMKASNALELGASEEDYPGYGPYHTVVLNPGTYYLAVYSTDPTEAKTIVYESREALVDTELTLEEGKRSYFFSSGKDQKTYFCINVTVPGVLKIDGSYGAILYDIQLCDMSKNPISEATLVSHASENSLRKTRITILKEGTYYLQVSPQTEQILSWPYEIRYTQENNKGH